MNILIEATGGLTSGYLIKAIKSAGYNVVGSDIDINNHSAILSDQFILMPKSNELNLWDKIEEELKLKSVDVVIPSLDETLLSWSEKNQSDRGTKWLSSNEFNPTPRSRAQYLLRTEE